jgi:CDP-glycerol glycerophosphotransferase (TagB/SpsB family)
VAVLRRLFQEGVSLDCAVVVSIIGAPEHVRQTLRLLLGEGVERRIHIVRKNSLSGLWAYMRSNHVFFTHGLYMTSWLPSCQVVVNLWHGMPLKALWKANAMQEFTAVQACTHMLCTSPLYGDIVQRLTGLPRPVLKSLGFPRNDLMFSRTPAALAFREKAMTTDITRLAVFLPTFRQTRGQHAKSDGCEGDNALMMSVSELAALQRLLAPAQIKLLVKPHPMSVHYGANVVLAPNIQVVSDGWLQAQGITLYEALGQADFLITDVSSVYVDYLCLNRPVFFYFPDLEAYRKTRGFVFEPIQEWLAGRLCINAEQLLEELSGYVAGRDPYREARHRLAGLLNPQKSPTATDQLLHLLGLLPESDYKE